MLTQCPDCGQSLSTEAPACPHCGRPNRYRRSRDRDKRLPYFWVLLVALGPIGFLIDFIAFPSMRRLLSFFLLVIGLFIFIMASLITDTKKMEVGAMISLIFLVAAFISFAITMYLEARIR
ncbi:zinc ribbon domain-containing protein [Acidithiobacillus ferrooxidans F221]|nr:zinc ribbon domain-containing protein [Acidithiobacillus ferrooxidans F221]